MSRDLDFDILRGFVVCMLRLYFNLRRLFYIHLTQKWNESKIKISCDDIQRMADAPDPRIL